MSAAEATDRERDRPRKRERERERERESFRLQPLSVAVDSD
jgi:hypothetical protein